jgi:hypothetical protein
MVTSKRADEETTAARSITALAETRCTGNEDVCNEIRAFGG